MDRVDPKSVIAAASLDTVDGSGRTLAAEASSGGGGGAGDTALGSGAFGKVGTYRYHGATVAVKELKAGADEDSIGALCCSSRPARSPTPNPYSSWDAAPVYPRVRALLCSMFRRDAAGVRRTVWVL